MKVRIALVTLLLVLVPFGMAMAQQPTNLTCPNDNAGIMHFSMMGDKYMVNNAHIVQPNMMATNGMAQGIDAVVLPTFAPPKNLK